MSAFTERAVDWLYEAVLFTAKVLATVVLVPFSWWLPGPELLIARMWGKTLTEGE